MNSLIIFTASDVYLVSVVVFIGFFFYLSRNTRFQFILTSVFALPFSYILGKLVGMLFYDSRPFVVLHIQPLFAHAADNGFPSDHALLMGTLAAIATAFNLRVGIALWILAILVGAARVLGHVHHAVDILGSFVIALIATYVVRWVLKTVDNKKKSTVPVSSSEIAE